MRRTDHAPDTPLPLEETGLRITPPPEEKKIVEFWHDSTPVYYLKVRSGVRMRVFSGQLTLGAHAQRGLL